MYLSRVEVDTNNRAKIKDLTHLGAYHNWVEQSFPDEIAANQRTRHLWRIDQLGGKKYLLVLSENQPDKERLEHYGVAGTAMVKSYDQFLDRIQTGQVFQFRLVANPTYAVTKAGETKHQIFPHVTVEQQRGWLMKKADKNGFAIVTNPAVDTDDGIFSPLAFDIVDRQYQILHRNKNKSGRQVKLSQVTFEGLLQVTDADVFRNALTHGIGREKAFGMGMMTVIPEG
ncbi:type I-E CRISPR-associated protein Cas6/Cse3/CasE [Levilactobacillus bambusae]|uniref:Type I-E CRISPR-associated protein Cas6/Cse3/CasE n=1 Tax=Levilactobacillus bambusae TaxID=2024736 RepID=A0A2V1MZN7_9LACO|nr:type I-E CRISPR-associated protein Cas6/Cse3/CasE [Levilactobacillus bambusae]PWG00481.1 type I-E CRISPR-associated protein Cas6/Cse3/CasE [Levilactobacillus bambusae]